MNIINKINKSSIFRVLIFCLTTTINNVNGFATRPISVNRQSTGDVIYDYMSECGETAWGSPGTCICKRENESFYEVKEGRLCSRLSQIISHENCDGEDEFAPKEMTLQCTPASINVKVRNKLSGKEQAFWDDTVNSTLMEHFETGRNNRQLTIQNTKGGLNGLLIKFTYRCQNESKENCNILKFVGTQNYPLPGTTIKKNPTTTTTTTTTITTTTTKETPIPTVATSTTPSTTTSTTSPKTTPITKRKTTIETTTSMPDIAMKNIKLPTTSTLSESPPTIASIPTEKPSRKGHAGNTTQDNQTPDTIEKEQDLLLIIIGAGAAGITIITFIVIIILCCKFRGEKTNPEEGKPEKVVSTIHREDSGYSGYSSPSSLKINNDGNNKSSFKSYIQDSPEYQALQREPSNQYKTLESAFSSNGYSDLQKLKQEQQQQPIYGVLEEEDEKSGKDAYDPSGDYSDLTTITLPTPHQPIYGVLEEHDNDSEQDLYEPSADYTKIGNPSPQPIYGELESENIYNQPEDEQPVYREIDGAEEPGYKALGDIEPGYKTIGDIEPSFKTDGDIEPNYNTVGDIEEPDYNTVSDIQPDYNTVDDIYMNNSVTIGNNSICPDNNMIGTLDKPKLAPKPKFIPPLSPPIRHRMASGELERNQYFSESP